MLRRLAVLFLSALLLLTSATPVGAAAAPAPKVTLAEAVAAAKTAFPVPPAFSEFDSSFTSYGDQPRWELNWHAPDGSATPGSLNVTVDANTKDILEMHTWQEDRTPRPPVPKYSRAEAEKVACEFARRLQPLYAETRPAPEPAVRPYWGGWESQYSFVFERVVNGVPFAQNGINVEVDGNTLKVVGYRFNWNRDQEFPAPAKAIDAAKARAAFLGKAAPRLIYFRPTPEGEGEKERPVLLVYDAQNASRYGVDALTSKVIPLEPYWYGPYGKGDMGGGEPQRAASMPKEVPLTPAEQAEVEKLADFLSQEEALAKAEAVVQVPADYKLESASLSKNWEYPAERQWNFNWTLNPKEPDKKSGHFNVQLDAKSGELLSFSHYTWDPSQDTKEPNAKYNEEQAKKRAVDFVTELQAERFAACKEEPKEPAPIILLEKKPVKPRSYSFQWVRQVNAVPFPQQGFWVSVDAVTGEITSYRMNWYDLNFPKPEGLLSQEQASDILLKASPLELEYVPVPDENFKPGPGRVGPVRLVYRLRGRDDARRFDAKTGAALDWNGNPLPDEKPAAFSDIAGHAAASDIALLAERQIVTGSPDGK
ncbi:MAG TPA: S-layer homology domain-containing protein, partial [Firmicutes bacterium]|nr:S-layer homology domain-containing protein [Bacillota bacterium]